MAAAFGPNPRFLVPSLVWYGLSPRLNGVSRAAGVPELAPGGWGGMLASEDDVAHVLLTLDPAMLLLNLAGYQVSEVAIGVPAVAVETAAADLVDVDLATMGIARGTAREWTPLATAPASAQIALWVEPRYAGPPAPATGPTLSLAALTEPMGLESIHLGFADSGSGWLRLAWPAGQSAPPWHEELARKTDLLTEALIGELEWQQAAAAEASEPDATGAPLCGLLSLYDSRSWAVPFPYDEPFDRLTPAVTLFGERLAQVVDEVGFGAFLRGETSQASEGPPTALERWATGTSAEEQRQAVDDLSWCVDELVAQCLDGALAEDEVAADFAATAYGDLGVLTVTALLLRWQDLGVLDFLGAIEGSVGAGVYGGYDLQRDDDDATHTYGGDPNASGPASPADKGYVAQLREDLAELGFGPMFRHDSAEEPMQNFDVWLERAVRELQLYARMPNLAAETNQGPFQFYSDRLSGVPNPLPYSGPVCGVVNGETRSLIQRWLERGLRCPVVIEARSSDGGFTQPFVHAESWNTDNVWRADQVKVRRPKRGDNSHWPRFFARDFTAHWTLTPESVAAGRDLQNFALGEWTDAYDGGPWSDPPDLVWAEAEITTDTLLGRSPAALTPAERSTFRVIRAVAEVESIGYFDCFNGYDPGFISAGPYHWTLGLALGKSTETADAELPPYFAYLKGLGGEAAAAYEDAFGVFGCGVTKEWPAGTSGATSPCWEPTHRKYAAWVEFEGPDGAPVEAERADHEAATWFRQWHWFLRFALNARTLEPFRTRMWDYARLRLRDLLATPWTPQIDMADPSAPGGTRPATIGDLFTSERAVGIMARWHVNRPSNLLPLGDRSKFRIAYANAGAAAWGDPGTWTDQNEANLCNALYDLRPADPEGSEKDWLRESLDDVYEWPSSWGRNPRRWQLPLDAVLNIPQIAGLVNGRTDPDNAYTTPFTVDSRDGLGPVRPPTARSSDQGVVADARIAIAGAGPNYTLTATPVAGATGTTTITVTADNGTHAGSAGFFLTVDGPVQGGAPPPSKDPVLGLSIRRDSFQLA